MVLLVIDLQPPYQQPKRVGHFDGILFADAWQNHGRHEKSSSAGNLSKPQSELPNMTPVEGTEGWLMLAS